MHRGEGGGGRTLGIFDKKEPAGDEFITAPEAHFLTR
jgi:hypothetical protein